VAGILFAEDGAELNLLFFHQGSKFGIEGKFSEAPEITHSMQIALHDLDLFYLWVVYPGTQAYQGDKRFSVLSLQKIPDLIHQLK
jgi:hypothetical protein